MTPDLSSSRHTVQAIATGAGSALLIGLVAVVTSLLAHGDSFVPTALAANAFSGLVAIAAWSGALFRRSKGGSPDVQPESWQDWVGIFFAAFLMSALFLFMDCGHHLPPALGGTECDGHPGISVLFTFSALAMTAIALPSALRAWLLAVLSPSAGAKREV